jgi:hypothetical protein
MIEFHKGPYNKELLPKCDGFVMWGVLNVEKTLDNDGGCRWIIWMFGCIHFYLPNL